mgnify:CR=1 FL=1
MKKHILFFSFITISCSIFDQQNIETPYGKVYVALQGLDAVGIVNIESEEVERVNIEYNSMGCGNYLSQSECEVDAGCVWHNMGSMSHCMDSIDECMNLNESDCINSEGCDWMMNMCMNSGGSMNMGTHTPHFISIDDINQYWFVTTITSGYLGRYNLDTDELIDNIFVGDSPALISLNEESKKLYISRMMPMQGMMTGSESSLIQEIDYSDPIKMIQSNEYVIGSPAPHGISINSAGSEVYTVSNTADWFYKINLLTNYIEGAPLDSNLNNSSNIAVNRLKPIQCLSVNDSILFITCSSGIAYNSYTGENDTIPGIIQMWNSNTMKLIDNLDFSWNSSPWHLVNSPKNNSIFVVLSGDNLYPGSAGVVNIQYDDSGLNILWDNYSELFKTLHGIDITNDGQLLFVSGRGDGMLHLFDSESGELIKSIELDENLASIMAGGISSAY